MGYLYLIIAIIGEVVGTLSLKSSNGFTVITPSVLVIIRYGTAFYFMILTMKTIHVGITYAIWSGVGIAAVTFIASIKFGEKPDVFALIGLSFIIVGIIILVSLSKMGAKIS